MNKKLVIILIVFILVILISFVAGEETYFNQCIQVYDSNGSSMIGLNCTFKDHLLIFNELDMTDMNNGLYCININDSFADGNYTFTSKCTDGNISRVVFGDFIVGAGEEEWNWLYIGFLFVPLFLIILSKKTEDPIFTIFAGILFTAFVPIMYTQGYPNWGGDFIFDAFAMVLLGMGLYFMIVPAIKMIGGGD